MPYVISKLVNSQTYTQYAKSINGLNQVSAQVEIKGGADITNKNLITPEGVITKVTPAELEILKANKDFQKHLEHGHVRYFSNEPDIDKVASKLEKDNSAPLTPSDYVKKGKTAPKVEKE